MECEEKIRYSACITWFFTPHVDTLTSLIWLLEGQTQQSAVQRCWYYHTEGGRKLNVQQGNSLNWFLHTCYSSSCFVSGLNWGQSVTTIFFQMTIGFLWLTFLAGRPQKIFFLIFSGSKQFLQSDWWWQTTVLLSVFSRFKNTSYCILVGLLCVPVILSCTMSDEHVSWFYCKILVQLV